MLNKTLLIAALFCLSSALFAQDNPAESGIRLKTTVSAAETPLNRTVELVLRLTWSGDLSRYEISPFDDPLVTNLKVIGSGSSNRVAVEAGQPTAVREYTYTLQPQSLGMAYVEPMIIRYTDTGSGEQYYLSSGRIPIKVVDPIRESLLKRPILWLILFGAAAVIAAGLVIRRRLLKRKEMQNQEPVVTVRPIEETYLEELRGLFDPSDFSSDGSPIVEKGSRLLRRYLQEKYEAPGLEATTSELCEFLYAGGFDELFINKVREFLTNADLIKFSGRTIDRNEAVTLLGVAEAILQSGLRGEIHRSA